MCFSSDGKQLASGSWDRTVRLWDVETGACVRTLEGYGDWVICVCFSPDGKQLVSGSNDKTVRVWDVETGACVETHRVVRGHDELIGGEERRGSSWPTPRPTSITRRPRSLGEARAVGRGWWVFQP